MSKKYFGTDGVRGAVGQDPMTADFALRLASAAAQVLVPTGGTVLIGKDTRLSGYMFESALEAGFTAAGADVLLVGPLPTPGVAYLTQEFSADLGVVISASHNLYYDNGIKFFDGAGSKLSDEVEEAIEASLDKAATARWRAARRAESGIRRGQRGRLQGRAADPRESRRRSHPDRLFAQWPQYQ
jgi:phosphoglucosamine mutase